MEWPGLTRNRPAVFRSLPNVQRARCPCNAPWRGGAPRCEPDHGALLPEPSRVGSWEIDRTGQTCNGRRPVHPHPDSVLAGAVRAQ